MTVLFSRDKDPLYNLSCEAYLHGACSDDFLLFYRNDRTVVIGRNQCAAAEADLELCARESIPVIRRISGGGAVWHDPGNINYCFIRTGTWTGGQRETDTIISILAPLGIEAVRGPRGELLLCGNKISGTASFCRGGRYIFHGTLLYECDLEMLSRALSGNASQRGGKIASVPSKVANISSGAGGGITTESFFSSLVGSAGRHFGCIPRDMDEVTATIRESILERFAPDSIL
ncbi:MAG: lipoate--protein ligase family protein [Alistipes sp.]|nr:lipoate--protein ligase family protein [Alistipes sp.]